jgi:hypothetical protein
MPRADEGLYVRIQWNGGASSSKKKRSSSVPTIVGVLCALVVVALIIFFVRRKNKPEEEGYHESKLGESLLDNDGLEMGTVAPPSSVPLPSTSSGGYDESATAFESGEQPEASWEIPCTSTGGEIPCTSTGA